ncbi:MAG TPA: hypothetical protein VL133_02475, partial [Devosia sp.]|nr:hypothetical protein [Devosia sp.]
MQLANFRTMARYNVLTPITLIAALCCATSAIAADQVVGAGVIDTNGVELAAGDSLTNSGTISNPGNVAVGYPGPDTGTIAFVLNIATGTITATGDFAVG